MFELAPIEPERLRSKIVTTNRRRLLYMPFAFTDQGVAMLSRVLNSEKAIEINIAIIRNFVALRKFVLNEEELRKRLTEIENQFPDIYKALDYLVDKDNDSNKNTKRNKIGYKNKVLDYLTSPDNSENPFMLGFSIKYCNE